MSLDELPDFWQTHANQGRFDGQSPRFLILDLRSHPVLLATPKGPTPGQPNGPTPIQSTQRARQAQLSDALSLPMKRQDGGGDEDGTMSGMWRSVAGCGGAWKLQPLRRAAA